MKIFISLCSFIFFASQTYAISFNHPHKANELIIKFKDETSVTKQNDFLKRISATVLHRFSSNGALQISIPTKNSDEELKKVANILKSQKDILYIELNNIVHSYAVFPSDTRFNEQYSLYNTLQNGTSRADISAPEAWEISTGSSDVIVAMVDTGFDYTHPDLAPNAWINSGEVGFDGNGRDKSTNGIDDDENGFVDDVRGWNFEKNTNDPMDNMVDGHGSHCAGVIGAKGNDNYGVAGINWQVKIMGVRFLDDRGAGYVADGVKAIEYAISMKAHVINNSWGNDEYSPTLLAALRKAEEADIFVVNAAGNDSRNAEFGSIYPAGYLVNNNISVAATNDKDELAEFSNYGFHTVHIAAPGVEILSVRPWAHGWAHMSGTSMASPHVAGVAALIKSAFPNATYKQIKRRLMNNVDIIPSVSNKVISGGRLNAFKALEQDATSPNAVSKLEILEKRPSSVVLSWMGAGDDGDDGEAVAYETRLSSAPITSESAWKEARVLSHHVLSKNHSASKHPVFKVEIVGLPINAETQYIAVRAIDNVGLEGDLSETVSFTLPNVKTFYVNHADHLDGVTIDSSWDLEQDTDLKSLVFSDSPGGPFENSINSSLTLPIFDVPTTGGNIFLSFLTKYAFDAEKMFADFGFVEISTDAGTTWQLVKKMTGISGWTGEALKLNDFLGQSNKFQLRFRIATDWSEVRDGWLIDDITIYSEDAR